MLQKQIQIKIDLFLEKLVFFHQFYYPPYFQIELVLSSKVHGWYSELIYGVPWRKLVQLEGYFFTAPNCVTHHTNPQGSISLMVFLFGHVVTATHGHTDTGTHGHTDTRTLVHCVTGTLVHCVAGTNRHLYTVSPEH